MDLSDFVEKVWREDERSFQSLMMLMLLDGSICRIEGWAPCLKVVSEMKIPGAVLDLVGYHEDGSITVFELKRAGEGLRDYMTGIGQLIHAQIQFGFSMGRTNADRIIRFCLAVPSGVDVAVGDACLYAGIDYMPVGTIAEFNAAEHAGLIRALARKELERRRMERHGPQISLI
jgi:hypothetical protein